MQSAYFNNKLSLQLISSQHKTARLVVGIRSIKNIAITISMVKIVYYAFLFTESLWSTSTSYSSRSKVVIFKICKFDTIGVTEKASGL